MSGKNFGFIVTSILAWIISANFAIAAPAGYGVNLERLGDWSVTTPFVNLIATARGTGNYYKPSLNPSQPDQFPNSEFGIIVFADRASAGGKYRLEFKGQAVPHLLSPGTIVANAQPGVFDLNIPDSARGLTLQFGFKEGLLALRGQKISVQSLSLRRVEEVGKSLFSAEFIKTLQPFSVLRFMDWTRTNNQIVSRWSDRPRANSIWQSGERGAAWEHVVALGNEAGKDIWINIPYMADEDYLRQLALLLYETLEKPRKVYVEYSNEIWNPDFKQHHQNNLETLRWPQSASIRPKHAAPWIYASTKLKKAHDIFASIFGQKGLAERVRFVWAGQLGNPATIGEVLRWWRARGEDARTWMYGFAIAPYFGIRRKTENLPRNRSQIEEQVKAEANEKKERLKPLALLAKEYQLKMLAYEGGVNITGSQNQAEKREACQSETVAQIYGEVLRAWREQGGGLYVHYNHASPYNQYGCWGLTDDSRNWNTPKAKLFFSPQP